MNQITSEQIERLQETCADPSEFRLPVGSIAKSELGWITEEEWSEYLRLSWQDYLHIRQMLAAFMLLANDIPLEV